MKTTAIEGNKANGKVNSTAVNGKADNKGAQSKTNGLALSKELGDKAKNEAETPPKGQRTTKNTGRGNKSRNT